MAVGREVNVYMMNDKAFAAITELRSAFQKVEAINAFLGYHPRPSGQPDPLDEMFNYTPADSYALRVIFEQLEVKRAEMDTLLNDTARQLTGLE